jgi:hypothetical protein
VLAGIIAEFPFEDYFAGDSASEYWEFGASAESRVDVTSEGGALSDSFHLKLEANAPNGSAQAQLSVDFIDDDLDAVRHVAFDFWAKGEGTAWLQVSDSRGISWANVLSLGTTDEYQHYTVNLDGMFQERLSLRTNDVRFRVIANASFSTPAAFYLDNVRFTQGVQTSGPAVVAVEPLLASPSGFLGFEVRFSEPMEQPRIADFVITSPTGDTIEPVEVTSRDGVRWSVVLPQQNISGTYSLTVLSSVRSAAPSQLSLNQDFDFRLGEHVDDRFFVTHTEFPAVARELPLFDRFEEEAVEDFAIGLETIGTTASLLEEESSRGDQYLLFAPNPSGTASATWLVDFDSVPSDRHNQVNLEFWTVVHTPRSMLLEVSRNGVDWTVVDEFEPEHFIVYADYYDPAYYYNGAGYLHIVSKLEERMLQQGLPLVGEALIRLSVEVSANRPVIIDDFRISTEDVIGPAIEQVEPLIEGGRVVGVELDFNEPIDVDTIRTDNVSVYAPSGEHVAWSYPAIEVGEGARVRLSFNESQHQFGGYRVDVLPSVQDVAGNYLNENQDEVNGWYVLPTRDYEQVSDRFSGFALRSAQSVVAPVLETFSATRLDELSGWEFRSQRGTMRLDARFDDTPTDRRLRFLDLQDATLWLDLSASESGEPLALSFDLEGYVRLAVSGDGQQWHMSDTLYQSTIAASTVGVDFGAWLDELEIERDARVGLRFVHDSEVLDDDDYFGYGPRDSWIDNVRLIDELNTEDVQGAFVEAAAAVHDSEGRLSGWEVRFSEPVQIESMNADAVKWLDPWSQPIAIGDIVASDDNLTFTIQSVVPPRFGGTYTLEITPAVRDVAGNSLDQDRDAVNGEAEEDRVVTQSVWLSEPRSLPLSIDFDDVTPDSLQGVNVLFQEASPFRVEHVTGEADDLQLTMVDTRSRLYGEFFELAFAVTPAQMAGPLHLRFELLPGSNAYLNIQLSIDRRDWWNLSQRSMVDTVVYDMTTLLSNLPDEGGVAYLRLGPQENNANEVSRLIVDNLEIGVSDVVGPYVARTVRADDLSTLTVTFNEPVRPETFTSETVQLRDPHGQILAILGEPVSVDDEHRTFELQFETRPLLGGFYRLWLRDSIEDAYGNHPDFARDGLHMIAGLGIADSVRALTSVNIAPLTFPVDQRFDVETLHELRAWDFQTTVGSISLDTSDAEHPLLEMRNMATATLYVDLSNVPQDAPIVLELTAGAGSQGSYRTYFDGRSLGITRVNLPSDIERFQTYDLRYLLRTYPPANSARVPLRFELLGGEPSLVQFERVRIYAGVVAGARVAEVDTAVAYGQLESFVVTFDREIQPASFTVADVEVIDAQGAPLPLAKDPVDLGDHRSFRIVFATPQTTLGMYTLTMGPEIMDVDGYLMNQNGDIIAGDPRSDDYSSRILVLPSASDRLSLPIDEAFEVGNSNELQGWALLRSDYFGDDTDVIERGGLATDPYSGSTIVGPHFSAVVALDLSAEVGRDDLVLQFNSDDAWTDFDVSGDGLTWQDARSVRDQLYLSRSTYHFIDLDEVLDFAGIDRDEEVYLRFSPHASLDNVRIDRRDVIMAPADHPWVESFEVIYENNEPVGMSVVASWDEDVALLSSAAFEIWDPLSRRLVLEENPVVVEETNTVEWRFAESLELAGTYAIVVSSRLTNGDGVRIGEELNAWPAGAAGYFTVEQELIPQPVPYSIDFSDTSQVVPSAGWRFDSYRSGPGGIHHEQQNDSLRIAARPDVSNTATLALDLRGESNLELVYLQNVQRMSYGEILAVSDDAGLTWHELDWLVCDRYPTVENDWTECRVDLDEVMQREHLAYSSDFRIRIGTSDDDDIELGEFMLIDQLRVTPKSDGAYVATLSPQQVGNLDTPVTEISLTFSDTMNPASFTLSDVLAFRGPDGDMRDEITGWRVAGDTAVLQLMTPLSGGAYELVLSPEVLNANLNPLDTDRDGIDGEPVDDRFVAVFHIAQALRPEVHEDFAAGVPQPTAGWSVYSPLQRVSADQGALKFSPGLEAEASEAVLHLDLLGMQNIMLSFDREVTRVHNTISAGQFVRSPLALASYVAISDDFGENWFVVDSGEIGGHVTIDLDNAIHLAGMHFNSHFAVKFANYLPAGLADAVSIDNITVTGTAATTTLVGREIFYAGSSYDDGTDAGLQGAAAAGPVDSPVPADGKRALLPGQYASFANYTSYSRGINAIAIDVSHVPDPEAVSSADFSFRLGSGAAGAAWTEAPAPASVRVIPGAGSVGSDRILITWDDGAIQNTWLEVVVHASPRIPLAHDDLHYWGNLVGETGSHAAFARVGLDDELAVMNHYRTFADPPGIEDRYDFNRDGRVDAADAIIARNNTDVAALTFFTPAPLPSPSRVVPGIERFAINKRVDWVMANWEEANPARGWL